MHRLALRAALAAALALAIPAGHAADIGTLLQQADAVRSSDPAAFQRLLAELSERQREATPAERHLLRYFRAYERAFSGDLAGANQDLRTLFVEAEDNTVRFRAALSLANNSGVTREFAEGFRALDDMLALLPDIEDAHLRQIGLLAAAGFLNLAGQYAAGAEFSDRLLAESPAGRTRCMALYLQIESAMNIAPEALDARRFGDAIDLCIAQNERVATNLLRTQFARHLASSGDRTAAIALLEEHRSEAEASRYPLLLAEFHALLAEYQLAEGQLGAARANAERAIEADGRLPTLLPLVSAQRTLYEVAQRRGDSAAALDHYRRYAEADKAYLDDVKARELAFQMVRHETEQKTQTIALLNKQNEVLQLEQEVARTATTNTRLLALLLGVLVLSIAYWAYKIKRVQMNFRRLAESDALTGVSNRHHFTRLAEETLAAAAGNRTPVALVMFDLDHFKSINDEYGHATGDWVLRAVAECCRSRCRAQDVIGRVGGEEFAILLPDCDADGAARIAQQCREGIAAIQTAATGTRFAITASFGVADTTSAGYQLHGLLLQADQAMYRSKREGRDRVYSYGPAAD